MAKKQTKTMETKNVRCTMILVQMLVALVVLALGLFTIVEGFSAQLQNGLSSWRVVLPWYFFGLLLLGTGKVLKRSAHVNCPVHGNW